MARLFTEMTRSFQVCFPKTFSLTEDQFSGKTYFYTIRPCIPEAIDAEDENDDEEDGPATSTSSGESPSTSTSTDMAKCRECSGKSQITLRENVMVLIF